MSGVVVNVRVIGAEQLIADLEGLEERSMDLTVPLKQSIQVMLASIDENFSAQGRPFPWAPLSPGYLRRKMRQGYSPNILQRTGRMMSSIVGVASKDRLEIGTAIPYAPFHQFGTRTMPMRKFLAFQDADLEDIKFLIQRYVAQGDTNGL